MLGIGKMSEEVLMMDNEKLPDLVMEFVMTCNDEELRKLTVSSLAKRFHVDRSHLAREFKAGKNFTLSKLLQGEKMARAASLLSSSSKFTLKWLSQKMGFCTSEYFREVFKKYFGVVPSKYREYKCTLKRSNLLKLIVIVSQNELLFHDLSLTHVIIHQVI